MEYEKLGFAEKARSPFKINYFNDNEKILIEHWLPESKNMTEADFKSELLRYKSLVIDLKPSKVLVNSQELNFVISPENQIWMANEIFTAYPQAGMSKKAFLMPKDFFTQISMEQHILEDKTNAFVSQFFDDFDSAWRWLNE